MAKLTRDDVLKLARLSRITLSDDEADKLKSELSDILGHVEQLQSVDTSGVKVSQVGGVENATRPDKVVDYGYEPADLLKQVPAVLDNQIKVKRMLG